ncbi:MAG: hypothetical protein BGO78_13045 [Chloroflexi bacterium 44-23]|nr:MAG: hypothetical protein BGO78_13045 [Chloroflexi bacterium 44-23]
MERVDYHQPINQPTNQQITNNKATNQPINKSLITKQPTNQSTNHPLVPSLPITYPSLHFITPHYTQKKQLPIFLGSCSLHKINHLILD